MAIITLDAGQATTSKVNKLKILKLNDYERDKAFCDQFEGVYGTRLKTFQKETSKSTTHTESGIKYTLVQAASAPDKGTIALQKNLKVALGCISQCTSFDLSKYPITIYVDASSGSAGYVVEKSLKSNLLIEVFFGKDVYNETPSTGTAIIANYLYVTGRKIGGQDLFDTRMLAMIFHEFGHVFHQLNSPSHYFALGHLSVMKDKGISEYGYAPKPTFVEPKTNLFNRKKLLQKAQEDFEKQMSSWANSSAYTSRLINRLKYFGGDGPATIVDFAKGVIEYTKKHMGTYAGERMPEMVAEGFTAQMMGVGLGSELQALFETYGGMVPNDEMKLSTDEGYSLADLMSDFKKKLGG